MNALFGGIYLGISKRGPILNLYLHSKKNNSILIYRCTQTYLFYYFMITSIF